MRKKDIFEENKELQSSLFLAQSYQDAWADYGRSLKKERFGEVYNERVCDIFHCRILQ